MKLLFLYFSFLCAVLFGPFVLAFDLGQSSTQILTLGKARSLSNFDEHFEKELSDWKNPSNKRTSDLSDSCAMLQEARIVQNNSYHYFVSTFVNKGKAFSLKTSDIDFEFGSGLRRKAAFGHDEENRIEQYKKYILVARFPRKEDFKNQSKLTVRLQIRREVPCESIFEFQKPPDSKDDLATSTSVSSLDVQLAGGVSYGFERLSDRTDSHPDLLLVSINSFSTPRNGFYFSRFSSSFRGRSNLQRPFGVENAGELGISSTDIGYVGRLLTDEKKYYLYKLGLSSYSLEFVGGNEKVYDNAMGLHGQLEMHNIIYEFDDSDLLMNGSVVIGLDFRWIFLNLTRYNLDLSSFIFSPYIGFKF